MKRFTLSGRRGVVAMAVLAIAGTTITAVSAYEEAPSRLEDDGVLDSGKDAHHHHDHEQQHGEEEGHLDPVSRNVEVIGNIDLFTGGEQPGRIADVSAKGSYAYLTHYYEPTCSRGGVQIVDIADPTNPKAGPFIPSHTGTFSGEGSQVVSLQTSAFKGDVLVFQNEVCPGYENTGIGGVTLVDVTNPLKPKKLVEGFGDTTVQGQSQRHANQVHSAFAWQHGSRAFVVMNDDEEFPDVDILEITNPSKPKLIAEYDLRSVSEQSQGAVNGDAAFLHDMVVKRIGDRQIMLLSYWDGGYIQMDVTDPRNATFVGDTDYAAVDPLQPTFTPEGNGHQAEFTRDNEHFVATDEDFDPYRVTATIGDGPYAGHRANATQGSGTPQLDQETTLAGDTRAVGLSCPGATIPPADETHTIAVVERGVCNFVEKIEVVEAAGYEAAIVFNRTGVDGCESLINMLVDGDIPALFVSRTDGFRILGAPLDDHTCAEDGSGSAAPAAGTDGSTVDLAAVFDGWGYVHLYDAETFEDLDQYAIPESQDPENADGFGDLSVHEVATDPDEDLAYISYYTGGLRVLEYGSGELVEVGAFIAEDGNNFWGVEVHEHPNGEKYVLASDRDSGLWIFQYSAGT